MTVQPIVDLSNADLFTADAVARKVAHFAKYFVLGLVPDDECLRLEKV